MEWRFVCELPVCSQPADGLFGTGGEADLAGLEQHCEGWEVELRAEFDALDRDTE